MTPIHNLLPSCFALLRSVPMKVRWKFRKKRCLEPTLWKGSRLIQVIRWNSQVSWRHRIIHLLLKSKKWTKETVLGGSHILKPFSPFIHQVLFNFQWDCFFFELFSFQDRWIAHFIHFTMDLMIRKNPFSSTKLFLYWSQSNILSQSFLNMSASDIRYLLGITSSLSP